MDNSISVVSRESRKETYVGSILEDHVAFVLECHGALSPEPFALKARVLAMLLSIPYAPPLTLFMSVPSGSPIVLCLNQKD